MSDVTREQQPAPVPNAPSTTPEVSLRPGRLRRVGASVLAQGEPMLWLTSGGLIVCLVMIIGLMSLIAYQGSRTFWPSPVVQLKTLSGVSHLGELAGESSFEIKYGGLQMMGEAEQAALRDLLNPQLHGAVLRYLSESDPEEQSASQAQARQSVIDGLLQADAVTAAAPKPRLDFVVSIGQAIDKSQALFLERLKSELRDAVSADNTGDALFAAWSEYRLTGESVLYSSDLESLAASLAGEESVLYSLFADGLLTKFGGEAAVPMHRRMLRTGNYELTNEHFNWVSDFEIVPDGESTPEWAIVFERIEKGRFYGFPESLKMDDEIVADEPATIWQKFQTYHAESRARYHEAESLSKHVQGEINRRQEAARLALKEVELASGLNSEEWKAADIQTTKLIEGLDAESAEVGQQIEELRQLNSRYVLVVSTANDVETELAVSDIVRAYPANQLTTGEQIGVYF